MTDLVLVSYLNTLPFLNGLETEIGMSQFRLIKEMPADCAKTFINGKAQIALLPVGTIPYLPKHQIITDFCIGCDGEVRTVVILSKTPMSNVKKIYLDMDSRSSSLLAKIVLKDFNKLDIEFINGMPTFPLGLNESEAVLMIGDKVFEYEGKFEYKLDLGQAWKLHTGLPFTFAVWVSNQSVSTNTIASLNTLLSNGIKTIRSRHFESEKGLDLDSYFRDNISYVFDDKKQEALELFLTLSKKYLGEQ